MKGRRAGSTGYVVVLIGAAGFVVGLFLPYVGPLAPSPVGSSLSLYRLYIADQSGWVAHMGWLFHLFAGVVIIAGISITGIVGKRRGTPAVLAAASAVWSLTWIGSLMGTSRLVSPHLWGYRFILVTVGVVLLGTVLVWVSARSEGREEEATDV